MERITIEQYEYLLPMNEKYGKWLDDKITARKIYQPFKYLFETLHYHLYKREDGWRIISDQHEENFEGMFNLIKEKPVFLMDNTTKKRKKIHHSQGKFYLNNEEKSCDEIKSLIFDDAMITDNWQTDVNMLVEQTDINEKEIYRLYLLNTEGDNSKIANVFIVDESQARPIWRKGSVHQIAKIEKAVISLSKYTPQLEFFSIDMVETEDGFKIVRMDSNPEFPLCDQGFCTEISDYLFDRFQDKKANLSEIAQAFHTQRQQKRNERRVYVEKYYPKGYYPFRTQPLIIDPIPDFDAQITAETWASDRGFFPSRISQYAINEDNQFEFISDFEYSYLGQVNNKYRKWFEDKVTIKYILRNFNECLPAYYYLVTFKNEKNRIIRLMDCPDGFLPTYEDIFRLVREKGILALKPDEGTHGLGFFRFSYQDEKYFLNVKEVSKEEVIKLLDDINNQYLITEFIVQHPDISNIYSGSVNTARMTVFKKDGKNAHIGNGYMRFGTKATGGVDNIGAGGISVDLDITTGHFCHAIRVINETTTTNCSEHPDTGVTLEGHLPDWKNVCDKILNIAESLPEIEYMGFDVAFTENGIKLPEINRMPDYPKLNKLTPATLDYLQHKLRQKKKKYGYPDLTENKF